MGAARPAAGPTLSVTQIGAAPIDALAPGVLLLGGLNPTDPFVARERGNVTPSRQGFGIGEQRISQIPREVMNDAAWNLLRFSPADHAPQSNFSSNGCER